MGTHCSLCTNRFPVGFLKIFFNRCYGWNTWLENGSWGSLSSCNDVHSYILILETTVFNFFHSVGQLHAF